MKNGGSKPRDTRLRECFEITPIEGVGERVVCLHCSDYDRTLAKFNATKARAHLTDQCVGVSDELRQALQQNSQAAKKRKSETGLSHTGLDDIIASPLKEKKRKSSSINRLPVVFLSFHQGGTSLIVTAPIEKGELILHLTFPRNELNLKFNGETNLDGAAACVDGFMNTCEGSWTASLRKVGAPENLGTAGDYCQWKLDESGSLSRTEKVKQILKSLVTI